MSELPRSVVGLIETPSSFVLQRRPDLPGRLAYPGKVHFFGGGVNEGETPAGALLRDFQEEFKTPPPVARIEPLWTGEHLGLDKLGQPLRRHVTLLRAVVVDSEVDFVPHVAEGGGVVRVSKTMEGIRSVEPDLVPFARDALTMVVTGRQTPH